MAPTSKEKPRIKAAFKAMKNLGIAEAKTKAVLKKLLKLYDKNWDLIEEENYRVLADTIFEYDEVAEQEERSGHAEREEPSGVAACMQDYPIQDEPLHEEQERPLKRLRKGQAAPSNVQLRPTPGAALKIPKAEPGEPDVSPSQQTVSRTRSQSTNRGIESASPQPLVRNKGKQPVSAHNVGSTRRPQPSAIVSVRDKRVASEQPSHGLQLIVPKVEPGIVPSEMQKQPQVHALIKPKDEPFTDDMVSLEPLAVVPPEPADPEVPSNSPNQVDNLNDQRCGDPEPVNENGIRTLASSNSEQKELQEVNVSESGPPKVDIAASHLGEVKISLSCDSAFKVHDFQVPDLQAVFNKMNDNCIRAYKIMDPEFSLSKLMTEFCDCVAELGTNGNHMAQEGITGQIVGAIENNGIDILPSNGSSDGVSTRNMTCVTDTSATLTEDSTLPLTSSCPQTDMQRDKNSTDDACAERGAGVADMNLKSIVIVQPNYSSDITKGKEAVKVSLEKYDCGFLPSFRYIPRNYISNDADVKFSLGQIGDGDCCLACDGDCLTSSTCCNCMQQNGEESPYTLDGLVREAFLEECISMVRTPQQHCLTYCDVCPLERLKSEDILDPCKGHLRRKFIKECWTKCGCGRYCGNRVVQRGVKCNLQVFWTPEGKGWGLRTMVDLPKGTFVCEYVGEILTTAELHKRNLSRSNDKHSYSFLLDTDWGTRVLKEEEFLCLDATFYGNVARFINHRCSDANLIEIPVEIETPSHHYYHVALFTTMEVNAFEELTWDYGVDFDDNEQHIKAFRCFCGSQFCRNMKRSSRSRSALTIQ